MCLWAMPCADIIVSYCPLSIWIRGAIKPIIIFNYNWPVVDNDSDDDDVVVVVVVNVLFFFV